jgi:hypothetical protein
VGNTHWESITLDFSKDRDLFNDDGTCVGNTHWESITLDFSKDRDLFNDDGTTQIANILTKTMIVGNLQWPLKSPTQRNVFPCGLKT